MKRRNLLFLCAGIGIGLVLGVSLTGLLWGQAPTNIVAPSSDALLTEDTGAVATASESTDGTEARWEQEAQTQDADEAELLAASAYPAWDKAAVYTGGDKVLHQGKLYRAKWWTQGETPGKADVWEDTRETPAPATPAPQPAPPKLTPAKAEGFKVVGYYPAWKPGETEKLHYDVLTHVNYAFAIPTPEGGLRPLDNEDTARTILKSAHANGVKVLVAVGGWSYQDTPLEATFVAATQTEGKRAAFVDAIVSLCDRLGFDGVDMDWEHPRVDGTSAKQYEAFMLLLAEKLHAKDKLLTSAVLSGATVDGTVYYDAAAHSDKVLAAVDWINVMAYDGGDGERHASYDFAVNCGAYWRDTRGLAADKVVLGVPFYARPSWAAYGDILAVAPKAWNSDQVQYNGMTVSYNGVATIRKKTLHALEHLGGVMIWEVSQDTVNGEHSLLTAIGKTVAEIKQTAKS